jgi:hypothetical protein
VEKIVILKKEFAHTNNLRRGRGRQSKGTPLFDFVSALHATSYGKRKTNRAEQKAMAYSDFIDFFTLTLKPPLRLTAGEAAAKWVVDVKKKQLTGKYSVEKADGRKITVDTVLVEVGTSTLHDDYGDISHSVVQEKKAKRTQQKLQNFMEDTIAAHQQIDFSEPVFSNVGKCDFGVIAAAAAGGKRAKGKATGKAKAHGDSSAKKSGKPKDIGAARIDASADLLKPISLVTSAGPKALQASEGCQHYSDPQTYR